ncbi:MAG: hypothetical protein PHN74_03600 [Candidatus Pacebacteria bacterium]|nr:hypothetical protein [Candidatus Paceibacterota bacterium]
MTSSEVLTVATFLICLGYLVLFKKYGKDPVKTYSSAVIHSIAVTLVVNIAWVLIVIIPMHMFVPRQWENVSTVDLVSLNNSAETEGNFFLDCGSIGQIEYYFFHKELEEGGYKRDRVSTRKDVTVYETNDRKPALELWDRVIPKECKIWRILDPRYRCDRKYKFYIPKGSLKRDFVLR